MNDETAPDDRQGMHMGHQRKYAANCSLLFKEVDLLERAAAAKAHGFDAVEFWWPWPDQPVPGDADVDAFIASVRMPECS